MWLVVLLTHYSNWTQTFIKHRGKKNALSLPCPYREPTGLAASVTTRSQITPSEQAGLWKGSKPSQHSALPA